MVSSGALKLAVIISGQGEFLAEQVIQSLDIDVRAIRLSQELGATVSQCATAHALAVLAREAAA